MFMVTRFTNKMMDGNVNLMTFIQEPCQLVLMWLMTLLSEPCHGEGVLNKNDRQNLTLLTFDQEPCQLVVMWLMILPSSGCMFMVAKFKKRQTEPNPNDSRLGTLSVSPDMVNDFPFIALSHWWHIYGNDI